MIVLLPVALHSCTTHHTVAEPPRASTSGCELPARSPRRGVAGRSGVAARRRRLGLGDLLRERHFHLAREVDGVGVRRALQLFEVLPERSVRFLGTYHSVRERLDRRVPIGRRGQLQRLEQLDRRLVRHGRQRVAQSVLGDVVCRACPGQLKEAGDRL